MSNLGPSSVQTTNNTPIIAGMQLLYLLRGANLQLTTDQIFSKVFTGVTWDPQLAVANWTSGAYNTSCLGGIFSLPNKGGSAIVATSQSYSALTGPNTHSNLTVQATTTTFSAAPYFNLSTANAAALTADIFLFGFCLD